MIDLTGHDKLIENGDRQIFLNISFLDKMIIYIYILDSTEMEGEGESQVPKEVRNSFYLFKKLLMEIDQRTEADRRSETELDSVKDHRMVEVQVQPAI